MARPEDFVAFKLDIDSNAIEEPLVEQILTNPNLTNLVDEFFFEYHVKYGPVEQHWQWTANQAKSLRDSYDLFATMRKRGIRAHGWP